MRTVLSTLMCLSISVSSISCANYGKNFNDSDGDGSDDIIANTSDIEAGPADSGTIRVTLADESLLEQVEAYVLDQNLDMYRLNRITDNGGNRYLSASALPIGSYDLILKQSRSSTGNYIKRLQAHRINGVDIRSGKPQVIEDLKLYPSYTVTGQIKSRDGSGVSATLTLPGTKIEAISGNDGSFEIKNVPVGKHQIRVDALNFHTGVFENLVLPINADTEPSLNFGALYLSPADLELGIYTLSKSQIARDFKVNFLAIAPADKNQMRISEFSDFSGAPWIPLRSSFSHVFNDGGQRNLFVQFAKNGTAVTEIFSVEIDIQLP